MPLTHPTTPDARLGSIGRKPTRDANANGNVVRTVPPAGADEVRATARSACCALARKAAAASGASTATDWLTDAAGTQQQQQWRHRGEATGG